MKWIKTLTIWMMLALWLPAANHCRLESIPGLLFLACDPAPTTDAHQESDCESDNCAQVERALYKAEDSQVKVESPVLSPILLLPLLETASLAATSSSFFPVVAPPELPVTWQFHFRAAAPPRAPSLAS